VALAAVALAVAIPLAVSRPGGARSTVSLELVPKANPGVAPRAEAAPATCAARSVRLRATPTSATLAPGQKAEFSISEMGAACDLTATVSGPSKAGFTVKSIYPPLNAGGLAVTQAYFQLVWSGTRAAAESGTAASSPGTPGKRALPAGSYVITVRVPHTRASVAVEIAVT